MINYMEIKKELEEMGEEEAFEQASEMLAKGNAYAHMYSALYSEDFREIDYRVEMLKKKAERINEDAFQLFVMEHYPEAVIGFFRPGGERGGTIL